MIILFVVIFSFLPLKNNYKFLVVKSGSMEPQIHTGSLIFIKPASEYNVGDVITRQTDEVGKTITHRISDIEKKDNHLIYKTKGDANTVGDGVDVESDSILGKVFFDIPYIGYLVNFIKTTEGIILFVVIPTTIIVYEEILKIKKEIFNLYNKKKVKKEESYQEMSEEIDKIEFRYADNPPIERPIVREEVRKRRIV
jgi:signal peptidase